MDFVAYTYNQHMNWHYCKSQGKDVIHHLVLHMFE